MKTHTLPLGRLILVAILIALTLLASTFHPDGSHAYPGPGDTPEPTCFPPSPDYPEPCHEHGGPGSSAEIYLPVIDWTLDKIVPSAKRDSVAFIGYGQK
jgi:hypothetical protein